MKKLVKMVLKKALSAYSKAKSKTRLHSKEFKVKYVDSISMALKDIKKMPYEEQVRTDFIIPEALHILVNRIRVFLNYECERVVVKRVYKNGKWQYILFDGHHRYKAFQKLGFTHIIVDVIELEDDVTIAEVLMYKYILNEDFPKAGNSPKEVIKIVGEMIVAQYGQIAKDSKLAKKKVRECFRKFVRKTASKTSVLDDKIQKEILQTLYSVYSSHKEAIRYGKIRNWTVADAKKDIDYNDQTILQNVVMGRNSDHPECAAGYGGLDHKDDPDCVLMNRIYLNKTFDNIKQNLVWAVYHYKFTTDYETENFDPPVLFLFYVSGDCNGNIGKLEKKREDLQKYFYTERHNICIAKVREYCHSSSRKVSEKEQARVYEFYKRMVGNFGCVPQLDDELGFVTSSGNTFEYPYEEDLYYV